MVGKDLADMMASFLSPVVSVVLFPRKCPTNHPQRQSDKHKIINQHLVAQWGKITVVLSSPPDSLRAMILPVLVSVRFHKALKGRVKAARSARLGRTAAWKTAASFLERPWRVWGARQTLPRFKRVVG